MAAPKVGSRWRVVERIGKLPGEMTGPGTVAPIPAGTEVEVLAIVPAEEQGAHDNTEDAVVVGFDELAIHVGEDGHRVAGEIRRHWACAVDGFGDLFEKVT